MPRPKKTAPDYRYHVSGQAVVTFNATNFYLGAYDSPESRAKYRKLLTEYIASDGQTPSQETHQGETPITVSDVTREYREKRIEKKYANNITEKQRHEWLCDLLDEHFADIPANEFGPRRLSKLRDKLIAKGNARSYINKQISIVRRVFRFAVSCELVKPETLTALDSLESLCAGESDAPESDRVQPVDIEVVRATAKHLSPVLVAMVRIQAATGMRPSELCRMRPCDIDMTNDDAWIYRPAKHKTAHKGKSKAVPIIQDARAAIMPFLSRNPEAFCFSPAESVAWLNAQRLAKRVTPATQGNRPGTNRVSEPMRKPGTQYDARSYRQAIERAAKKAKVPHWFPYQLRHLAGTVVRDALGIEAAQALLGHSHAAMTEHYAKQSEAKAVAAAKAAPKM